MCCFLYNSFGDCSLSQVMGSMQFPISTNTPYLLGNTHTQIIMSAEELSFEELVAASAEGEPEILCELGRRYLAGEGVTKSTVKGRKALTQSAEAGCVKAMELLADSYSGDRKDGWKTYFEYWSRRAVENGSQAAAEKFADYFYLGEGDSNKNAAILYLESARRKGDDCEREVSILTRMLESNWLEPGWKFYGDVLQLLADNGNRDAKHMIRREEVPEPTDDYDLETLLSEGEPLPEAEAEEQKPARRTWGRQMGKRSVTSVLYDMGIEFTKSSNGIIKTKKGKEIEEDIRKLIDKGYKFKYSYKSDKWTCVDKRE